MRHRCKSGEGWQLGFDPDIFPSGFFQVGHRARRQAHDELQLPQRSYFELVYPGTRDPMLKMMHVFAEVGPYRLTPCCAALIDIANRAQQAPDAAF
jgi:hypothetical protein